MGGVAGFLEKEQSPGKTWSEVVQYCLAIDAEGATSDAYMKAAGQAGIYYEKGQLDAAIEWQKKAVAQNQSNRSIVVALEKYAAEKALQSGDASAPAESDPANGDAQ